MVKAVGLTIVTISLLLFMTCGYAVAHPPPTEPPPEGYPGFDPEDRLKFKPLEKEPGFSLEGDGGKLPIIMGPAELVFRSRGDEYIHPMVRDPWNTTFDHMNFSMSYTSTINKSGFGPLDLFFSMAPSLDGSRKIFYNLSISGELDIDQVLIRWGFGLKRENMDRDRRDDFRWKKDNEGLSLNSSDDRSLMKVKMYKHARLYNDTEFKTKDILLESGTDGTNGTIDMMLDIEGNVDHVETSGYMEFLEEILEVLDEAAEQTEKFVREHWTSMIIGATTMSLIAVISLLFISKRKAKGDPVSDLDYKQSKFFKGSN